MPIIHNDGDAIISSSSAATKGVVQLGATADHGLTVDETSGDVFAGKAGPAANATGGFLRIPVVATAPSGTPTAKTGFVAICFCAADSKIYVYNGSAWVKSAALS